jgi:hypothetical protein
LNLKDIKIEPYLKAQLHGKVFRDNNKNVISTAFQITAGINIDWKISSTISCDFSFELKRMLSVASKPISLGATGLFMTIIGYPSIGFEYKAELLVAQVTGIRDGMMAGMLDKCRTRETF